MIEAKNLKKIYKPKRGVPVPALDGVSLKLPDKGMVFILGKSGSGKSTLLNVLGGLDMVDSGEIIIKGVSAKDFKQPHYDSYRNTYVGFIFQEYNILEEFSVGANVALAIELQGRKPTEEEINSILKKVDLEGYGNRKPNELSGGQKQRVAIARALVKNPEIIMADEPTGALDSTTGRQVFDTLKSLSKEKLVLIVSHDREFSEQYADRIIELADGKIISDVEKVDEDIAPITEENLTYNANEIEIKKGYVLTEGDLKAINEYIASLSDDAKLVIKGEKRPGATKASAEFKATDESTIEIKKDNNFKLIKSKLSLKNAFKIGASGLKHKKVRLVFTIFLSFIAFALFGLADTIASYDNVGTAITSIVDSKVDYASFKKKVKDSYSSYYLSEEDISLIKNHTGLNAKGVYFDRMEHTGFNGHFEIEDKKLEHEIRTLFPSRFSGFAEITESDLQSYGYTLFGKLPTGNKNEIAISKYIYDAFEKAGFAYMDSANKTQIKDINSPDDIIGMEINIGSYGKYVITGIIDTGFDYTRYNSLLKEVQDPADMILQMALSNELSASQEYSINCVAFVGEGTIATIKSVSNNIGKEYWDYGSINITNQPDVNSSDIDYENYLYYSPSRLARLTDVSNDIIWLNGRNSLAPDEYIVTTSFLVHQCSISKDTLSESEMNALRREIVYNGVTHTFLDTEPITLQDFAFQYEFYLLEIYLYDNFDKALEYYKSIVPDAVFEDDPENDKYAVGIHEIIDTYRNSLYIGDYTRNLDPKVQKYIDTEFYSIAKNHIEEDGLRTEIYLYKSLNTETVKRDFKLAGIIIGGGEYLVCSDEIYSLIFGEDVDGIYSYAVAPMPSSRGEVADIVRFSYEEFGKVNYSLQNSVTYELDMIDELLDVLGQVFLYVGLALAVFASLMLSNFIGTSVALKKQEIGILRAIGSRSNDVFRIFFAESFIIAMINFFLAIVSTGVVAGVINSILRDDIGILITILSFGVRQIGLLLIISVGVAFISTFLPVKKIASKKPIDAIRKR